MAAADYKDWIINIFYMLKLKQSIVNRVVSQWQQGLRACVCTKEQLLNWDWKNLHYFVAGLFRTLYTRFHQNQPGFADDMTQTFWLTFYWCVILESLQNMTFKFCKAV